MANIWATDLADIKRICDAYRRIKCYRRRLNVRRRAATTISYASRSRVKREKQANKFYLYTKSLKEAYYNETGRKNPTKEELKNLYLRSLSDSCAVWADIITDDNKRCLQISLATCSDRMHIRNKYEKEERYEKLTRTEMISEHLSGVVVHDEILKPKEAENIVLNTVQKVNPTKLPSKQPRNDTDDDKYDNYDDEEKNVPLTTQSNKQMVKCFIPKNTKKKKVIFDFEHYSRLINGQGIKPAFKYFTRYILDSTLQALCNDLFRRIANTTFDNIATTLGMELTAYSNGAIILMTITLKECLYQTGLRGIYCDGPNDNVHEFNRIPPLWMSHILNDEVKQKFGNQDGYPFNSGDTRQLLYFVRNYMIYALKEGFLLNGNIFESLYQIYNNKTKEDDGNQHLKFSFYPRLLFKLYQDLKLYATLILEQHNKTDQDSEYAYLILNKLRNLERDLSKPFGYLQRAFGNGTTFAQWTEETKELSKTLILFT